MPGSYHQPINHEPTPSQGLCVKCGVAVGWRVEGKCSTCLTTLDHINTLRSLVESLSCITTHDWSDDARAVEAAADHLDDLAATNCGLEGDIARLNERVECYRKAFDHAALWVRWIANEAEDCEVVRAPSDLSRQCAGMVPLVEPIPQPQAKEPTTHE